jgi:RNA polymerase-binding transcription factor DksA
MNKKQLTHLEKRLLEERARVMKELGYYDESFNATLQSSDGDLPHARLCITCKEKEEDGKRR